MPGGVTAALDDRHGGAGRGGVLPAGEGVRRGEAGQQVLQRAGVQERLRDGGYRGVLHHPPAGVCPGDQAALHPVLLSRLLDSVRGDLLPLSSPGVLHRSDRLTDSS